MIFQHFLIDVNESNSYIVGCEFTREALLVDVADWDPQLKHFLKEEELRVTTILITHDHFDHSGGLGRALKSLDARVVSGSGRAGGQRVEQVRQGDIVQVGRLEGRVVETPGHTPESISLIMPPEPTDAPAFGMVFTGDALFSGSVGGTTSPSDHQHEVDSLREHVLALPDHYEIHPGHGPSSTVGVERRGNPFFTPK